MEELLLKKEGIEFKSSLKGTFEALPKDALFVVDSVVLTKWPELMSSICQRPYMVMEAREDLKTLAMVEKVYEFLFQHHETGPVVAVGGGILGDVVGFAAATFKRGIPFILVPTTLLAMCDSTLGGKVGVNYKGVKNYVGAFYKPQKSILCQTFLKTLPAKQLRSGLGELLKYGLLKKDDLLEGLFHEKSLVEMDFAPYILKGLQLKASVVQEDFRDLYKRNMLNFGHNVGHALEGAFPMVYAHGEAVALGLYYELLLSEWTFGLEKDLREKLVKLLHKFDFPTTIPLGQEEVILGYIRKDKKNDEKLRFTLLRAWGVPEIKIEVQEEELRKALSWVME